MQLTQNGFWGPGMPATSFQWFHLHFNRGTSLFGSHQRYLPPSVWHSLVGFHMLTSVCNAWQGSRTQNLQRVLKNSRPILTHLWTKVREILERCRRPLLLPNAFPHHILFRRHLPFSKSSKNRRNVKFFGPQFFGRNDPNFNTADY